MQQDHEHKQPWNENDDSPVTHAHFAMYGDGLDPEVVTVALGIQPKYSGKKGDSRLVKTKGGTRETFLYTGSWSISSSTAVNSSSSEDHLRYLLAQLEPVKENILRLQDEFSIESYFEVYWGSPIGQGGPEISPDTLLRIAQLRVTLYFELWDLSPD
ncbi:MAG: DUF4279 domain-containing protein [Armatimonadota bacterium]